MRVLLLSDANSPHTIKWAKSLSLRGVEVGIWSFSKPEEGIYTNTPAIELKYSQTPQKRVGWVAKLRYLTSLSNLKRFIEEFEPDILHAHYATSYGLLGRLTNFHPFILSVWGGDVYDFPKKGMLFRRLVESNLERADRILSTSEDMKRVTSALTDKDIIVTPFGIDLTTFAKNRNIRQSDKFVFGTIKTLEEKYGIRYLISAYRLFKDKFPDAETKLLIVGGGSQEQELKRLADSLGIAEETSFVGNVPYADIPFYHNQLDVAIFPSILESESFGVAAVEASACETPVIVSNVGGLPEVVEEGKTGIIVEPKSPEAIAEAMGRLYLNDQLRLELGANGRKRVKRLYDLAVNVEQMIQIYTSVLPQEGTDRRKSLI